LDRVSFSVTGCKAGTWTGVELAEAIADLGGSYGSGTMKEFLVNGGAFTTTPVTCLYTQPLQQSCYRYSSYDTT
jgi:hypothetical protein